jgi:hypothetical protein
MTRLEKCEFLKRKGYTYDPETGKIFGVYGKEIKHKEGYIRIFNLLGHHFAWYMIYGNVDFERLDHINQNRQDNRILNLRIVTHQQNLFNTKSKGYSWNKPNQKWVGKIMVNGKHIHLGSFNTEEEARQSYLKAKEKLHIIA